MGTDDCLLRGCLMGAEVVREAAEVGQQQPCSWVGRAGGATMPATTFPGVLHGFLRSIGHVKAADRAVAEAGAWLARQLA